MAGLQPLARILVQVSDPDDYEEDDEDEEENEEDQDEDGEDDDDDGETWYVGTRLHTR